MKSGVFDKKAFIQSVRDNLKNLYRKTLEEADQQEIFQAVSFAVKDVINDRWLATQQVFDKEDPKIVYYMSMEFLMGRALGNNLINLKEYKEVREALDEIGLNLDVIEDQEPDPALGNGGLGRLAACFMDSLSTLGYAAYGCGIRYRYGMFKQKIQDGFQVEVPDNWLKMVIRLNCTDRSTLTRSSLADMYARRAGRMEACVLCRRIISRCWRSRMTCRWSDTATTWSIR